MAKTKTSTQKAQRFYRQCVYESPTEGGVTRGVAWIPEEFAVVGKEIYFGKKTKNPERLWTVVSVGTRKSEDYVKTHERDYKSQRSASDI